MPKHIVNLLVLFSGILVLATSTFAGPKRIASLNLCTDELLLSLADPDQIISLTWLAREESLSAFFEPAHANIIKTTVERATSFLSIQTWFSERIFPCKHFRSPRNRRDKIGRSSRTTHDYAVTGKYKSDVFGTWSS